MRDGNSRAILLADYRSPAFAIESVDLTFRLASDATTVESLLQVRREVKGEPLRLYGEGLERIALTIDGHEPSVDQIHEDDEGLLIHGLNDHAEIRITSRCRPDANTALEGLYVSGGMLCTQCEPEGFRRIAYFPDRPDVLSRYRVRLEAERTRFPVLLANGNRVAFGDLDDGRHFAVWEDPFPKPSYLFALVAGDLVCRNATFTTMSGRDVALEIWVEAHNADRCEHALASLARAMRYDEEAFGREYDLDVYMIVAVDDFNMGAMENKGLNLFNAKYVLASPDTVTDDDLVNIEAVIAHEYFHNWSGNRVTCRDWFQLSLKEGLTVFRDQEFTTDCTLFGVKRIDDVVRLRAYQFPEDAGPLAHPVRPDRYAEINNFYTLTIYEKGAEVIRMLRTLLGRETFRRALDVYFERFDGQAVTTDDFVAVMAETSGRDLGHFKRWYTQAGTPMVTAEGRHDPATNRVTLKLKQRTPSTPGQNEKRPVVIPVRVALLGGSGRRLAFRHRGVELDEVVLEFDSASQAFELEGVAEPPQAISWLRGFSAPVRFEAGQTPAELAHLIAHDDDAFARWEAAQTLLRRAWMVRVRQTDARQPGPAQSIADTAAAAIAEELEAIEAQIERAYASLLEDTDIEPVLLATMLTLPAPREAAEWFERADPVRLRAARDDLERRVFTPLLDALGARQPALAEIDNAAFTASAMGLRRLRNRILAIRVALDAPGAVEEALDQCQRASSMTLRMGALIAINDRLGVRDEPLAAFEARYRDDPLVLDKFFGLQAASAAEGGFDRLDALIGHPGYRWENPNRVRAVWGPFMANNDSHFHRIDGEGYRRVSAMIERLDALNPQTAARLVQPLTRWRKVDQQRGELMRAALERLLRGQPSRDLRDVLDRAIGEANAGPASSDG